MSEIYSATRSRLLDLASALDDDDAATAVPALPGWTVKDTYAHLAGVCADALDGKLTGPPTDEWTAGQVEERRARTLAEICDEWGRRGPALDAAVRAGGDAIPPALAIDAWTHEHDVRAAVGRPGARDSDATTFALTRLVGGLRRRFADEGLATLRVVGDSREWLVGRDEPVATLRGSDFELARALIGRRSRAQLLGFEWDGDPTPFVDHLHVFGPPTDDLPE
jgi:uncharacterized protein (TIGR03083 family)